MEFIYSIFYFKIVIDHKMDSNQNEATIKKSIEIGAAVTKNETDLPTNDDKVKKMEVRNVMLLKIISSNFQEKNS